jgi:flavodoxin
VILTKEGKQMPFLKEFLLYVFNLAGEEVYWLSTHCKDGNTERVVQHLKGKVEEDVLEVLKMVKGTKWDALKTEGIDLDGEFLWFDDNIFESEYRVLEELNKDYCLIKVEENLEELMEEG